MNAPASRGKKKNGGQAAIHTHTVRAGLQIPRSPAEGAGAGIRKAEERLRLVDSIHPIPRVFAAHHRAGDPRGGLDVYSLVGASMRHLITLFL